MNAIEQVQQRLLKYPSLSYHQTDNSSITVAAPSPNGFSLTLTATQNGYVVFFDGWHEEFRSDEEALNCFAFGLSDQCRLKVFRRGQRDYKWTVESRTDAGWTEDSTTGLLFFPFWKGEEIVYRQNSVIVEDQPRE